MKSQTRSVFSVRGLGAALALAGALALAPRAARAHIKMSAPADWITTNSEGDPQKITPCGVDPTLPPPVPPTATGAITTLHVGDKVTFNWTETVPHDGHFRIALAINSRSELTDPAVTKMNTDGTAAEVAISTTYPVLADNLFVHTAASISPNKAYTYTVTIPNTPCAKCTLQLLQFMANHPLDPSYFYHQCADVTILAAAGGSGGSGGGSGGSGGKSGSGGSTGGTNGGGGKSGGTGGTTSGTGGATTGTGGVIGGTGGATSGTGGVIGGAGGATTGTGGRSSGTGGATSGTGGATSGTGGEVATGSGGNAVGGGGSGATGSGGSGTGGSPEGGSSGGCACQLGAANGKLTELGLLGVALICVRRRRRARR